MPAPALRLDAPAASPGRPPVVLLLVAALLAALAPIAPARPPHLSLHVQGADAAAATAAATIGHGLDAAATGADTAVRAGVHSAAATASYFADAARQAVGALRPPPLTQASNEDRQSDEPRDDGPKRRPSPVLAATVTAGLSAAILATASPASATPGINPGAVTTITTASASVGTVAVRRAEPRARLSTSR